ncbi:recombinase family protein [Ochrobactrum teleogrylli]|uniref:Recombinase family protein n=1 Tax=Ochrobactrum teleogrylli TaxID=2479765 RepID=A0ABD5JSU8_9HYPH
MIIDWSHQTGPVSMPPVSAAAYVRMSTDHQRYSTDNQLAVIQSYAEKNNYEIVQLYADEGKSGLSLRGRDALTRLLFDIENSHVHYKALLVYDVSRLGRFQDPDEAAEIELKCKRAGVSVHYCGELFSNDGSMGSSIVKTLKRAMAGEYSRDLSIKVYNGQVRLIRLGFRQGGAAGYGLRRMLIDQCGNQKSELLPGQQKSIATDRVILVPGPLEEQKRVRDIYDLFVNQKRTEAEIAHHLNEMSVLTDLNRQWTRGTVHQVLTNEKYIGNNVWAKTSFKLKSKHARNPPEEWVRANSVFEPIVNEELFLKATGIILERSARLSDEAMLEKLAKVFHDTGYLSGLIIDEAEECPSSSAFTHRFGSLLRAYTLVGFAPDKDYSFIEINKALRVRHRDLISQLVQGLQITGGTVNQDPETDLLTINGEFTVSLIIARCLTTPNGHLRWKVRLDTEIRPDFSLVVRMDQSNSAAHDYYLLPTMTIEQAVVRLCEENGLYFDAFRTESLDNLYSLAARVPISEVA